MGTLRDILKDYVLVAAVVGSVAVGCIAGATNLCEYFKHKNRLDNNADLRYNKGLLCEQAETRYNFYEREDGAVDIIFGSYGAKKAYEHYLENHCSDGD